MTPVILDLAITTCKKTPEGGVPQFAEFIDNMKKKKTGCTVQKKSLIVSN